MTRSAHLFAIGLLAVTGCGEPATIPTTELLEIGVTDATGAVRLEIEATAVSDEADLRQGLLGRPALLPGEGFLLLFPIETNICINNLAVNYPIEALFLTASRQVIAIESLEARAPQPICHLSTGMVLELPAGSLEGFEPAAIRLLEGTGGAGDSQQKFPNP